jgi:CubicO group peptidase (beta-lactamase class C family)
VSVDDARRVIAEAIDARVFPAAAFEVGRSGGFITSEVLGTVTFDADAAPATHETIFDLASLTKPIATTTMAMELVRTGALTLDARVADFFEEWRGADRETVTVRDLLEHSAGLPARLVDQPPQTRREFEHDICTIALEYEPRTRSIYSDLGFILLGFLLERLGRASLAELFDRVTVRLKPDTTDAGVPSSVDDSGDRDSHRDSDPDSGSVRLPPSPLHGLGVTGQLELLAFALSPADRRRGAPTMPMDEDTRRGRILKGEVHDNYAAALGGVAGHAGLFGTAPGVGAFAHLVLRALRGDTTLLPPWTPDRVRRFAAKTSVPGSSRALGWDTMLRTSSCGTRMSASAIGHVGFTGTSLWIDPDRDRYFVLLTNRVCGAGTLDQMRSVRRAFHDALAT